jgi:16S rRNA G966 N2-methylase RsmD
VWLAEKAKAPITAMQANVAALGIGTQVRIETRGVKAMLEKMAEMKFEFDFVYIDPPYEDEDEYAVTLNALGKLDGILAGGVVVIAEHAKRYELAEQYGRLRRTRVLLQGDAGLSFYSVG